MEIKINRKDAVIYAANPSGFEPRLQNVDQETWDEICEYRRFLDDLEYQSWLGELEKIKNGHKE